MAKENKSPQAKGPQTSTDFCVAEGCKKSVERMHFCQEHFEWYKEGLIDKRGSRPSDFDKKHQLWLRKKIAA